MTEVPVNGKLDGDHPMFDELNALADQLWEAVQRLPRREGDDEQASHFRDFHHCMAALLNSASRAEPEEDAEMLGTAVGFACCAFVNPVLALDAVASTAFGQIAIVTGTTDLAEAQAEGNA